MDKTPKNEKLLKALANRRRLAILRYLEKKAPATVGNIAEEIKLSLLATSKHLRILRDADMVERGQAGPYAQYKLATPLHSIVRAVFAAS